MAEAWLMLVFEEVPDYQPAKSGKCWWKKFNTRDEAVSESRYLKSIDQPYKCKKVEDNPKQYKPRSAANGLWRN